MTGGAQLPSSACRACGSSTKRTMALPPVTSSTETTPRPLIGCWDSAGGGRVADPQHVVSADVAGRAGGVVGAHASPRLALRLALHGHDHAPGPRDPGVGGGHALVRVVAAGVLVHAEIGRASGRERVCR